MVNVRVLAIVIHWVHKKDKHPHTFLLQKSIPEPASQTLPISVPLLFSIAMATFLKVLSNRGKFLIDEVGDFALDVGYVPTVREPCQRVRPTKR